MGADIYSGEEPASSRGKLLTINQKTTMLVKGEGLWCMCVRLCVPKWLSTYCTAWYDKSGCVTVSSV